MYMKQNTNKIVVSKLFLVLSTVYITCLVLSNLIAGKICSFFGQALPAAVILFPITYILADVFTEVYGYQKMRLVIWLGFASTFFAVLIYLITIALPYPDFFGNQEAYRAVLGTTPRVAVASFVGYLFGEFSNSILMSKLKVMTNGKKLWLRTIGSTVVGEFFDSFLFISISFFGTMDTSQLLKMILLQYGFKVAYEVVFTPATYAITHWLKKKENTDIYDTDVSYSLFS